MIATPTIWAPTLRPLTLGLTLVVVATAFEALAVATILPTTLRDLGGLPFYGWTFSAFMLANLIGISTGGSECDRVGLARSFAIGMLLFAAGLAVSGFAPSMQVIVAGRVLQGFGAGVLTTVAYASIARAYTVDEQPRMLATLSTAWVIPGLVGPGLAAVVAEHANWRWVFLGLIPMPLIAAALVLPALRRLPRVTPPARRGEIARAVQLGIGATAALTGIGLHSWPAALALVLAGGVVSVHALRHLTPAGTLTARPGQPAAIASMALITFAFFGAEAFLPLALAEVRHASPLLSGLALTAAALTWTAGAWFPVRIGTRLTRRAIVWTGLSILGIGIAATGGVLLPHIPAACAVVAWAIAGFGMGLAFTTTSAAILSEGSGDQAGVASASLQLAQVLGAALATGVGGAIVAAPFAGDPPVRGIAIVDLAMLAITLLALAAARGIRTPA